MNCALNYCIYNRGFKCILDEVEINGYGMCDSSIVVTLEHEFLEAEKVRQLTALEARYKSETEK